MPANAARESTGPSNAPPVEPPQASSAAVSAFRNAVSEAAKTNITQRADRAAQTQEIAAKSGERSSVRAENAAKQTHATERVREAAKTEPSSARVEGAARAQRSADRVQEAAKAERTRADEASRAERATERVDTAALHAQRPAHAGASHATHLQDAHATEQAHETQRAHATNETPQSTAPTSASNAEAVQRANEALTTSQAAPTEQSGKAESGSSSQHKPGQDGSDQGKDGQRRSVWEKWGFDKKDLSRISQIVANSGPIVTYRAKSLVTEVRAFVATLFGRHGLMPPPAEKSARGERGDRAAS